MVIPESHQTVIPEIFYRESRIILSFPSVSIGNPYYFLFLDSRFCGNDEKNCGNDTKETLRSLKEKLLVLNFQRIHYYSVNSSFGKVIIIFFTKGSHSTFESKLSAINLKGTTVLPGGIIKGETSNVVSLPFI